MSLDTIDRPSSVQKVKIPNKVPHLFYHKNQLYSITINPNDNFQFRKSKARRIGNVHNHFYEHFLSYTTNRIEYNLHLDISEPTSMTSDKYPRIHFHGTICFKTNGSIRDWLTFLLPELLSKAYVDIDTISDPEIWHDYMTKYDHITKLSPLTNMDKFIKAKPKGKDEEVSSLSPTLQG